MSDFSRKVTNNLGGAVHVVSLQGELDMATAEGLAEWLVGISGSTVVVDLSELTFMDSSGITAIVMARNQMLEMGDDLILTRPHPNVERALEVVGLGAWVTDWDPAWAA